METFTKRILIEESGSALIIALLIMALLSIIAISTINTTNTEIQIAGNDKWEKTSFSAADGGTSVGVQLVELCEEQAGFDDDDGFGNFIQGDVTGPSLNLYIDPLQNLPIVINDANRDAFFPRLALAATAPHTNISIGSAHIPLPGTNPSADDGYDEGKKAVSFARAYVVVSQHIGINKSQATVRLDYVHVF